MPEPRCVLAIDQGTTSSRAIAFDKEGARLRTGKSVTQQEFRQIFPKPGWVEHDPEEIWRSCVSVGRAAIAGAGLSAKDVAGIGITNQRETTLLWNRETGEPVHNAIVWQDRRTADWCAKRAADGLGDLVAERTGLVIDAYFSASKIAWMLDNVPGLRAAAARGEIAFGTVDSFLVWRATGGTAANGARHVTDATNASRTMLFDIRRQQWDDELLRLFDIPDAILPEVLDSSAEFGATDATLFGAAIPITGVAGDQQGATVGQACFAPGMIKCTYGTGAFALINTGGDAVASKNRLLTTVGYRLDGATTYAIEGAIFIAGAAVQWLRDGLRVIDSAPMTEALAKRADPENAVVMVPAFTGLGAPYWDPHARGALLGLTRDTGIAEVARAALDAVCFQTRDLMRAMQADGAGPPTALRVDGGMVANDWLVQRLADILGISVERPRILETTALGAAYLAGLATGFYSGLDAIARHWQRDAAFEPRMAADERDALYVRWQDAVGRVRVSQ